ncbi:MAG: type II toxin-antitoxin system PemK/MazF family toxin [Gemmatimonadaceae bacterium]|nr:type II toxin-antitoxin system PemK/MazF family toxin [Gemmatimonadaceae bacterium]
MRGEVWQVQFSPTKGRERDGSRPAMILSVDKFNKGSADLVIAIPITRTNRQIASHVSVLKGEGGLDSDGFIMVEAIRSISNEGLLHYRGELAYMTVEKVENIIRVLLGV